MTDLTDKWKKGELESGYYYIVTKYIEFPNRVDFYNSSPKVWSYHSNDVVKEVLAPVPSYEEWQEYKNANDSMFDTIKMLNKDNYKLEAENTKLKELLKECKERLIYCTVSTHDVQAKISQALGEDK